MSKNLADPVHARALDATIEVLRGTLGEAIDYLTHDKHLAALGTLIQFEEQAKDVSAAIRLFQRSLHGEKRRTK